MQKHPLKALDLGATETLTRAQMKNVWGGDNPAADCIVKNYASGEPTPRTILFLSWPAGSGISCSGMSSWANSHATSLQLEDGGTTTYDCGCDGWGS